MALPVTGDRGGGVVSAAVRLDDRAVVEAELLLAVGVEAENGQIRMSVTGVAPDGGEVGERVLLVGTWADDREPVAVTVYDGRPDLDGWTLVDTGRLLVGTDGIDVGTTVSAVEHWVPVPEGPTVVEVWVRDPEDRGEVAFVLSR